ncbi:large ribosomal RNA subunit accumulation protein YCED homolog 1, chloroplastic [Cornus florida]|uniref:large ribosomal RNA subunit accumulation protein YCED homolog 1, chloroplastic n=1 Tax=Cornus florida TaxID=4283 RepID=UPI00289EFC7D|nr:large ribosomal RNA subunit accumulation protein YCED homolog 1, chloroplastic [Cornus florida]XP_059625296.1 large ribosomal RNA subunit accumulation protein YCED homolog 1, chloroplastic [Cornus florida]
MSLVFSSSSIASCSHITLFKGYNMKFQRNASLNPNFIFFHYNAQRYLPSGTITTSTIFKNRPPSTLKLIATECTNLSNELSGEESPIGDDWGSEEQGDVDDMGSPWEGAVVYKREASISHVEYCTTLERLGLGKLSTKISKSRASVMGLRVTKAVKDFPLGTPTLISIDVTRKKQKLRLDGIIRTVITLGCNRCGEPAAKCIFSNFTLLLTEEPIEEPDTINMGVIFGEDIFKNSGSIKEEEDDDEALIDLDDRLYFPPEEKEIDISKHIRDMVHIEITINALCDPRCKGLCLKCGANLNTDSCNCSKTQNLREKGYGPLGGLREQMQKKC